MAKKFINDNIDDLAEILTVLPLKNSDVYIFIDDSGSQLPIAPYIPALRKAMIRFAHPTPFLKWGPYGAIGNIKSSDILSEISNINLAVLMFFMLCSLLFLFVYRFMRTFA